MIRIDRGEEPAALANARSSQLARAGIHGRPRASADFVGHDAQGVRESLLGSQVYRCAYCELPIDQAGYPIEHFRPKTYSLDVRWSALPPAPPADSGQFFRWFDEWLVGKKGDERCWEKDADRYWWLAWTWENLFYGCSACNSQTHKGNKFPLKQGSPRLDEGADLPGDEQALLLDPSAADPLDHIRFAPDRAPDGWGPVPLTEVGQWTIAVLGLHRRPGMRSHWKRCAGQMEGDPDLKAALGARIRGDVEGVRAVWAGLVARWLHPESDFLALRWCVLDHHFEQPYRTLHGLPLPRPGKAPTRKRKMESDGLSASGAGGASGESGGAGGESGGGESGGGQ